MKYNPPFGSADPNSPYIDRDTPGAIAGSRVPAKAIEHPQREIMAVIAAGGLTPSPGDLTQLLQAIQQLISAATGGGDTSNFVLMPQARARLPIYPEVLRADGMIPIVSPSTGQVRVPAGVDFLHRGIFTVTTVQTDFATAASKTYHLRWSPAGGFVLKDLSDVAYNPGSVPEASTVFDSSYDDMLVARVVTSVSNVATITNLANLDKASKVVGRSSALLLGSAGGGALSNTEAHIYNFGRKPANSLQYVDENVTGASTDSQETLFNYQSQDRYGVVVTSSMLTGGNQYWAPRYSILAQLAGRSL